VAKKIYTARDTETRNYLFGSSFGLCQLKTREIAGSLHNCG